MTVRQKIVMLMDAPTGKQRVEYRIILSENSMGRLKRNKASLRNQMEK